MATLKGDRLGDPVRQLVRKLDGTKSKFLNNTVVRSSDFVLTLDIFICNIIVQLIIKLH